MVSHATLTGADLHEPKGVASATSGRVYVSDGLGSGSWKHFPTGWGYYQHSGSAQNITTSDTKLLVNGSGALTSTVYLPNEIRGSGNLWSTADNKVTPIKLGDAYCIRIDLPITAKTSAAELTVKLDIGGGGSPTTVILPKYESVAKTPPFTVSVELTVVALSAATVANGIQLFLSVDAGNIDITNPSILIIRTHSGDI